MSLALLIVLNDCKTSNIEANCSIIHVLQVISAFVTSVSMNPLNRSFYIRCFLLIFRWLNISQWCFKVSFPYFSSCSLLPIIEIPIEVLVFLLINLATLLLNLCLPFPLSLNLPPRLHLLLDFLATVNEIALICEVFDLIGIIHDFAVNLATMLLNCCAVEGCFPDEDSLVTRPS